MRPEAVLLRWLTKRLLWTSAVGLAFLFAGGCSTWKGRFFLSYSDYHYASLSEYHAPTLWEKDPRISFDPEGNLFYMYREPLGRQPNPVTSAQYALNLYDQWLRSGDDSYLEKFWTQVHSLQRRAVEVGNGLHFPYSFDFPRYNIKAPWISAMAQGHAASVFVRAWVLTRDPGYLDLSRRSLMPMEVSVGEGGVAARTPEGLHWLEEYPSEPPSLVLNGFVFAVIGVLEHERIDPQLNQSVSAKWLMALKRTIHHYEQEQWLLYDRVSGKRVTNNYMGFQILQMYQLFDLTGDPWFLEKAREWEAWYDWNLFFAAQNQPPQPLTHRQRYAAVQ